jgi:hypothetical protein
MKELIRHILKEETDNSDYGKKGIDIAVKLLQQDYPYIVGWELNQESRFTIYLNIICDIEKLKKFYNSDLKTYYLRHEEDLHTDILAYAPSVLKISETMDADEKYKEYSEMKQELNSLYQMLPDKFHIKDEYKDPKEIDPDKFIYR